MPPALRHYGARGAASTATPSRPRRPPLAKGGPCRKALDGPREALQAIHQGGLGGFRFESVELTLTVHTLAQAAREPTPGALKEARMALAALVEAGSELPQRRESRCERDLCGTCSPCSFFEPAQGGVS
jgi:hypothetical protein